MILGESFIVDGWSCRSEQSCTHGPVISLRYFIDVPVNSGSNSLPYRFSMHLLGEGFIATDFSPVMWHGCSDRFSNLTSREGVYVDFRHLVRVCFDIFKREVASVDPKAVFVVCGSRTLGEVPSISGSNSPTRKYRLYRKVFIRLTKDCPFRLVDDASHSLFLVSPHSREDSADDLLKEYWQVRARIDPLLGGAP